MQVKNCNIKITHNTMPHYKNFFYNFNNPTKPSDLIDNREIPKNLDSPEVRPV